ncbi:alanine--tRNA ligase [Actinobacillus pleuropneumoniae]|uniref:Alanine--tRNA ligase n=1 Tax=Actinobacillus pleuropneumoniae serotype 7 (strain AP76) TaxID=537457 RepID=SYA_ACTP7|nr:alanine--tRNA ligase [Actinobacillus pleuropneumoniae]B3H177.1 RecName: Full=Alanine--tRNA ligase; AltName: Full=Alanyl-tRNA synthetase; Short=AlaRS [Actinobacillus pleuropneumoniae serovar 7 str. AP76]ACE61346.1 alanyl-tRNA synthetase [Actinobacillus pleuropneumoniae serovar 7 str. AP76]EFN03079.1 Alanyl-tRNA synthetase [Actinobacillus pleuropneumoniae serovar 13 str. N273]MBT9318097.1 alanine--tRNA ligase [Actinobacillus pleuropneumoniae]MBT9343191.1 alanine--tRNA ligase [Actinobacillus p
MKTTSEIRQSFLDFFHSKGHTVVPSSSLVPENDPTLLFTNAGMNQFKDVFLGLEKRPYTRATTAQRCVRAGGKHNDLENVGYTARHHTFFEMMGNFSFGDYFKHDAIQFGWEYLTSPQWLGLPKEKLYVTVYETDDEAYDIWNKIVGVPTDHIIRIGDNKGAPYASDNFWAMGDTGPCGPCTEIFYDHGETFWGGLPGSPEEDGDRYIEVWNIVFMQFNRLADGTMEKLPKPSVDTGMGLERMTAVMQHVNSNYETDIFQTLIKEVAGLLNVTDLDNKSLRVVADHIRACSYLIADGVVPSNEGRGYVLRRIIRRAVRHGNLLGAKEAFFYKLVPTLATVMGHAGEVLTQKQAHIQKTLKAEEEQFARTLERGLALLEDALTKVENNTLSGEVAFKLYDTYGFPLDLTADVCREREITIDEAGFEAEMTAQRERAKASSNFGADYNNVIKVEGQTDFIGYDNLAAQATIVGLFSNGKAVDTIQSGESAVIILDQTPFYAEMGGQVGDSGLISTEICNFAVNDTQKYGQVFGHIGQLTSGSLSIGDKVTATVDATRRVAITANHSATHLLHSALREVLGDHVAQKGSLVSENILRFDFSQPEAISKSQLEEIERIVNRKIRENIQVTIETMDIESAKKKGAMALFGEKYGDVVRVVGMTEFSIELCGGTHVQRTGDIGLFKLVSEGAVAAGIRRVEAVTAETAIEWLHNQQKVLQQSAEFLKADSNSLVEKIQQLQDKAKRTEKELQQLKDKLAAQAGSELVKQANKINGVNVVVQKLENVEVKSLRTMVDDLKNQLESAIVVFGTVADEKVNLIVGVTKDLSSKVNAGELVGAMAQQVGGKGGGRADMAMAGGSEPQNLDNALKFAEEWIQAKL